MVVLFTLRRAMHTHHSHVVDAGWMVASLLESPFPRLANGARYPLALGTEQFAGK